MTLVRSPAESVSEAVVMAPAGGSDTPPVPAASWQEQRNGKWVLNFSQPIQYTDKVHAA